MSLNPYPTNKKVQMIFVPPLVLVDKRLTLRQMRVLLAIMQWRKKNSNISSVKRKILSDLTGYPLRRISTVTRELVELGWIKKHGNGGKGMWLKYEILVPDHLTNDTQNGHCIQDQRSHHIGNSKVTITGTQTGANSVTPINTVINTVTTHSNRACDLFIDNYPVKAQVKEVRQSWERFDRESQVTLNIELILQDIVKRLKTDRGWISGHIPNPLTYLNGERWKDDIRQILQSNNSMKPDWSKLPLDDNDLWDWAKKHEYSDPGPLTYSQYRSLLNSEVEKRLNK